MTNTILENEQTHQNSIENNNPLASPYLAASRVHCPRSMNRPIGFFRQPSVGTAELFLRGPPFRATADSENKNLEKRIFDTGIRDKIAVFCDIFNIS